MVRLVWWFGDVWWMFTINIPTSPSIVGSGLQKGFPASDYHFLRCTTQAVSLVFTSLFKTMNRTSSIFEPPPWCLDSYLKSNIFWYLLTSCSPLGICGWWYLFGWLGAHWSRATLLWDSHGVPKTGDVPYLGDLTGWAVSPPSSWISSMLPCLLQVLDVRSHVGRNQLGSLTDLLKENLRSGRPVHWFRISEPLLVLVQAIHSIVPDMLLVYHQSAPVLSTSLSTRWSQL